MIPTLQLGGAGLGGGPVDLYFDRVALLLHCDGANGSTTFTDSGPGRRTVTPVADAQISTAQSVFGGASGRFDGTGDYLTVANDAAFAFGSGAFTVECAVRFATVGAALQCLVRYATPGIASDSEVGWGLQYIGTGLGTKVRAFFAVGASYLTLDTTTVMVVDTWYRLAFVREAGGTCRLFVDGTQEASGTDGGAINDGGTFELEVGRFSSGNTRYLDGYIDELRITKGVARYAAGYALAGAAFPNG